MSPFGIFVRSPLFRNFFLRFSSKELRDCLNNQSWNFFLTVQELYTFFKKYIRIHQVREIIDVQSSSKYLDYILISKQLVVPSNKSKKHLLLQLLLQGKRNWKELGKTCDNNLISNFFKKRETNIKKSFIEEKFNDFISPNHRQKYKIIRITGT